MKPIVATKEIPLYLCPVCKKDSTYERDIQYCIRKHELEDLKKIVEFSWWRNAGRFQTQEMLTDFASRLLSDDEKWSNSIDYDGPDYEVKIEWAGPGVYRGNFSSYTSPQSGHYGGETTHTYTWSKDIYQV